MYSCQFRSIVSFKTKPYLEPQQSRLFYMLNLVFNEVMRQFNLVKFNHVLDVRETLDKNISTNPGGGIMLNNIISNIIL